MLIKNYLFEVRNSTYKDFHRGLGIDNVIGIRVTVMKEIAKEIYKGIIKNFYL